ncbi:hypothetical protein [Paenibacillus sp. FSL R7-0331]|uniref:hypothetical protein n=1 Tax=Paenibacillus sp. FSL R7-0331 TaxID=1536773 RepID=UPI0004F73535|nr:hypothetical protein [Paenibacillus sp. FSL R7-0331]AIQ53440.1 hypothetical protein R70331_19165 [Paenibacillus sp. FSL R7-0331]
MYEELDEYLLGVFTLDYWYDEGFSIARDMLEKFNNSDWAKLQTNVLSKPIDWQVRFAYCTDSGINDDVIINTLTLLSNIDNDELFETCVDSLRGIVSTNNIGLISDNLTIQRIEKLLPKCGVVTRKIFEDFIGKLQKMERNSSS